ncbi:MAG: hypothetical protein DCC49_07935 [Acidobacteria bacterium]|nr:MAG: hypothetical protein DCC49_07935 [Acidobacteriota bacterium]
MPLLGDSPDGFCALRPSFSAFRASLAARFSSRPRRAFATAGSEGADAELTCAEGGVGCAGTGAAAGAGACTGAAAGAGAGTGAAAGAGAETEAAAGGAGDTGPGALLAPDGCEAGATFERRGASAGERLRDPVSRSSDLRRSGLSESSQRAEPTDKSTPISKTTKTFRRLEAFSKSWPNATRQTYAVSGGVSGQLPDGNLGHSAVPMAIAIQSPRTPTITLTLVRFVLLNAAI